MDENEKSPLIRARDRVIFIVRYDYGYERSLYGFLLTFFTLFTLYYLLFLSPISTDNGDAYTYYLMTKRWPAGECKFNNKCFRDLSKYDKWVIHGLWPEFSNNTWDQFCTKNKFNLTLVEDLKQDLSTNWPNLLSDKDAESLWKHEWEKHGTCSPLDQRQYFLSTLAVHKNYDLTQWFKDANIHPSNSRKYSEAQFRDAIQPHIDHTAVQFNCEQHNHGNYLKEIYLCLSFSDAKTLVPCTVRSTCHDDFFYPSFK